jgi:hypothetical protein
MVLIVSASNDIDSRAFGHNLQCWLWELRCATRVLLHSIGVGLDRAADERDWGYVIWIVDQQWYSRISQNAHCVVCPSPFYTQRLLTLLNEKENVRYFVFRSLVITNQQHWQMCAQLWPTNHTRSLCQAGLLWLRRACSCRIFQNL